MPLRTTSNRRKSGQSVGVSPAQPGALPWLSTLQAAKPSPKIDGSLFSASFARHAATISHTPPASAVRTFPNNTANVIECATGGHGRCANRGCRCRCHKFKVRDLLIFGR